jgi:hypothetical protein
MSFFARSFSQVIARSATTTKLLLKPYHVRSLTLGPASAASSTTTASAQQSKKSKNV